VCCVLFEHGVLFCVICVFFFVLCLTVVPLPPGKIIIIIRIIIIIITSQYGRFSSVELLLQWQSEFSQCHAAKALI
jgi:hypothetical protein